MHPHTHCWQTARLFSRMWWKHAAERREKEMRIGNHSNEEHWRIKAAIGRLTWTISATLTCFWWLTRVIMCFCWRVTGHGSMAALPQGAQSQQTPQPESQDLRTLWGVTLQCYLFVDILDILLRARLCWWEQSVNIMTQSDVKFMLHSFEHMSVFFSSFFQLVWIAIMKLILSYWVLVVGYVLSLLIQKSHALSYHRALHRCLFPESQQRFFYHPPEKTHLRKHETCPRTFWHMDSQSQESNHLISESGSEIRWILSSF